ncbi:hypothetical protein H1C71_028765 [Ictidomys tridecemlineatus]|nr:hypothetical protein H1C71_028765 [Ictidomys tridecemlineatus]
MWHVESLNNYTQTALHDIEESISLLNTEITLRRKVILQNWMALDGLAAAQGSTCAIIKSECCVYIPDNSGNVTNILKNLHALTEAMSLPTLSWEQYLSSWFSGISWWKTLLVSFIVIILIGIFLCCGIYCCINLVPVLITSCFSYRPPITQMALQPVTSQSDFYQGPLDTLIFKKGGLQNCLLNTTRFQLEEARMVIAPFPYSSKEFPKLEGGMKPDLQIGS